MTDFFAVIIIGVLCSLPILGIIIAVRALMKKPLKRLAIAAAICVTSIIPLTILGVLTDPSTWCKHEYVVTKEVEATCTSKGEIHKHCTLCEKDIIEKVNTLPHQWRELEVVEPTCTSEGYTTETCQACAIIQNVNYVSIVPHQWYKINAIEPTCTNEGYTTEKCAGCSTTQKIDIVEALGHDMEEVYRLNPTPSTDGKTISSCKHCDYEEMVILSKLENANIYDAEEHIEGKRFSFQFEGSTAASYVKKFCNCNGHVYIASTFRGTPNDLSYLEVLKVHSDSDEIVWGGYYTITATISLADYDFNRTRINCVVKSNNIEVYFSVEFQDGFEEIVGKYKEGDVITFRGKFYDEGCGFKDAILVV